MTQVFESILVSIEDGVGRIVLNRPNALNAINSTMMQEVGEALRKLELDNSVRAIVLSAEGRAFCAGFDFKDFGEREYDDVLDRSSNVDSAFDFVMQFWDCRKPTISAVHGYCVAGGMELALACDLTIASRDALFGEPEVRFGGGIVAMLVPWMVGPKHAKDILLTGDDRITADRAGAIGLLTEVVEEGHHVTRALQKARAIASASRLSVELTKQAINRGFDIRGMRAALQAAADIEMIIATSGTPERKEFSRIQKEKGLKEAISWRNSRSQS